MRSSVGESLVFNGVDGTTGDYLLPAMTPKQVAGLARGWTPRPEHLAELEWWYERTSHTHWVLQDGDPTSLADAGWGVIFAHDADPSVKAALHPLLDRRREQAQKKHEGYYREFHYRPGESKHSFLPRYGVATGRPANPDRGVPYYLMIVGGPDEIPFHFQYQLDVQYAVGRVAFDSPEEYERYALSVVAAESRDFILPKKAAFFAVRNDPATELSHDHLVRPLAESMARASEDWDIETKLADQATKESLRQLVSGERRISLLFTASHGIAFPRESRHQRTRQGALLCQDWPGPGSGKPRAPHYLTADDVAGDARPQGLVAFHFACYGAGTPHRDSFAYRTGKRREIAPAPFVARLPQRLLGHPNGGALAIIGHIDLAWSHSFHWPRAGEQLQIFEGTLTRLLAGHRVGSAMELFNQSHAEYSAGLAEELEEIRYGKVPDERLLTRLWTANNDARNFVVLGDPAVRLPASCRGGLQ